MEQKVKIYQASTSELYGKVQEIPQNENPFIHVRLMEWQTICLLDNKNYREAYNMFAANGILFNHESGAEVKPLLHAK